VVGRELLLVRDHRPGLLLRVALGNQLAAQDHEEPWWLYRGSGVFNGTWPHVPGLFTGNC
jgi:hypothetical protein